MQFTSQTWLTDAVRSSRRIKLHANDHAMLNELLNSSMVQMHKATMPEAPVSWESADRIAAVKIDVRHSSAIQIRCISLSDGGSEEQTSIE